ncbi:hypothetical protein DFH08DRAFT_928374 [Mycena albidolilacea]|uniref:RRM domain-containing protein n=1 Tax=Mycena albidolilacea TaxID=1033008 RepID=A0AAD7AU39_9AGAR|nr:hypothetical protein DFH08DRAFT_928374 [Mycena albidolilacea]
MSSAATTENPASEEPIIDDGEEDSKEILLMKQRVAEMEKEAIKLRELQAAAALETNTADEDTNMETEEDKTIADGRSVYVGNVSCRGLLRRTRFTFHPLIQVDYGATPEEIQGHFQACGTINRVTILCDKFTGHPKGFAYVEFAEPEHIETALTMDNSLFRGRLIKDSIGGAGDAAATGEGTEVGIAVEASAAEVIRIEVGVAGDEVAGSDDYNALPSFFFQKTKKISIQLPMPAALLANAERSRHTQILLLRAMNFLRGACRAMSTAAKTYPFSKTALIRPEPYVAPPVALKLGKGLMPYLSKTLPTPEKQQMLRHLFSRQSRHQLYPGSIITVTVEHAPMTFTGVLLAIRRRGPDTSFVVRNIIQRTGVEMQFFVNSPHLKQIKLLQKPPKRRMRRAKLYYLRDSPEKMSLLAGNKKYQ